MQSRNDAACEIVLIPDTLGTKEFISEVPHFMSSVFGTAKESPVYRGVLFHGSRLEGFL